MQNCFGCDPNNQLCEPLCSKLWPNKPTRRPSVLCIGLKGSGKTELLRTLEKHHASEESSREPPPLATIGVAYYEIKDPRNPDRSFRIKEVGGAMQRIWPKYYESQLHAVLFVMDASDSSTAATAILELQTLMQSPSLQRVPVGLVLNKVDLPFCMEAAEIDALTEAALGKRLLSTKGNPVTPFFTSAHQGRHLSTLLQWLIKTAIQNDRGY